MRASVLLDTCLQEEINFFTGVPDSLLKGLCNELYNRYGAYGDTHVVAHNEGGAIALCAGHYLATGKPGLCYMQNSGIGNAVNPLTSLTDPEVYAIPVLLVIGWRGEPGVRDEPQHVKQGAITPGQLDLLGIPYFILSQESTEDSFKESFFKLTTALKKRQTAAIIVRKGALTTDCVPSFSNSFHFSREDAVGTILGCSGQKDIFVSTTGKLSRELFEFREGARQSHEQDFLTVGSMGHASIIAFRIAVEKPDRTVWCLDGDGASLMHLGALPVIGSRRPSNFIHVVINNKSHETVGGMPVCSGKLSIRQIAEASGYTCVYLADSEITLKEVLRKVTENNRPGTVLIEVLCSCCSRTDLGRPTTTPIQNKNAFMHFLA